MKILIGTNDNPEYYPFMEIVSKAWKKFFPDAQLIIGYVSEDYKHLDYISKHCDEVVKIPQVAGIPSQNISKVARPLMASKFPEDVCIFSDLDLVPLQKHYFNELHKMVTDDNYICSGFDAACYQVNPDKGKSPICFMLAKGKTIVEITNPKGLSMEEWISQWIGFKKYDTKEDISKLPFSDESLMRVMFNRWDSRGIESPRIRRVKRGWNGNQAHHRLDRIGWKNLDKQKLLSGGYIDSHMLKPFNPENEQFKTIMEYLES